MDLICVGGLAGAFAMIADINLHRGRGDGVWVAGGLAAGFGLIFAFRLAARLIGAFG